MKIHRSALGVVLLLVSFSMAKTIPTSEPISSGTAEKKAPAASLGEDAAAAAPPTKREVEEVPAAAIAVEAAQEPKQADRTKKSATTTFCVEIRPGPSEGPVKACDEHNPPPAPSSPSQSEPQIPNAPLPQELNHHQQSHYEEHEQQLPPFFVLPPNPLALYIPNNEGQSAFVNCPPHIVHHNNQVQVPGNPQHIIIPSAPASFPYPSLPSSSQHIIIGPSSTYPSIASSSSPQHLIIPSSALASGASQHIVIPSTGGSGLCPCQSATSANGLNPHTLISLFRSAMARNDDNNMSPAAAPMDPAMSMEMRSGNPVDWLNGINSGGSMLTEGSIEASNQMPYGSEQSSLDAPFARTHTKKIYALPIGSYYGAGYQAKSPYVVQCNPQVLALGGAGGGSGGGSTLVLSSGSFRDADGNANTNNNMENGAGKVDQMNEAQMNLGTPQGGRHVIHPIVQPIIHTSPGGSFSHSSPSVYQHSSTYQTYQSRPGIYPSHDTGYMIHPGSHFYRRDGTPAPQQLRSWMNNGNIEQNPSSDMEMQQKQQQQFEGKSWNQQAGNMEQQRGHGGAMSPSQMLNQMRGVGSNSASAGSSSSSFGSRTSPVMQSFPREHEESSPCKEGVHVNMHIPSGGQPFMITAPRNNRDDKNMATNHGGAMHDEMGKREAEKSAVSEIAA